jgi:hypothetical protein
MRKILFLLPLILLFSFNSFARRVQINHTVTSLDGCEWHITGWIDLDVVLGWPPVNVTGYDLTMNGPCGDYHFVGKVAKGDDGSLTYYDSELYDFNEQAYIPLVHFPQLNELINYLENEYDE